MWRLGFNPLSVENLNITYRSPVSALSPISMALQSRTQPITDHVVLQYLLLRNSSHITEPMQLKHMLLKCHLCFHFLFAFFDFLMLDTTKLLL